MLAVVQAIAASVGAVSGTSLQGAVRQRYGLSWAIVTLVAIVGVNVFTLAADVKAGSEAVALLTPLPANAFVVPFAVAVGLLLVTHSYGRIERYLSLLPIVFVAYAAAAILAHFDLAAFARGVFVPHFELSPAYVLGAIALLGTTLTSYVYVWESVEVAERRPPRAAIGAFERDAVFGMLAVGVVFLFIVVATAATLGKHHVAIETASDAAAALAPLAGKWSGTLFGIGLLASAVLAVPVLAATTAYVVAHTFGWRGSLDRRVAEAKAFYGVLLSSLAIASLVAFLPFSPVGILFWASIAGGVATPITLWFLIRIARDPDVMGESRIGRRLAASAWIATSCVAIAALLFLGSQVVRAL
jgi:Mn2+/Fe2+ NRAMP family transporter